MTKTRPATCPHCGARIDEPPVSGQDAEAKPAMRYDLERMAALAEREKAYDETVKVRVTQEQIRKLVEKKRRKKPA